MFTNIGTYRDRIKELIQNERAGTAIGDKVIEEHAASAVTWISRYVPRTVSDLLDGDNIATHRILLTELSETWDNGSSSIVRIEYPVDGQSRCFLDDNNHDLFPEQQAPTHIHFNSEEPGAGTSNFRVTYTVPHSVGDSTSTVPDHLEPGFELGGACYMCRIYSAKYGRYTDSGIEGDGIDYAGKSDQWKRIGDEFCKQASHVLGVNLDEPTDNPPLFKWVDQDLDPYPFRGLVHRGSTSR